MKKSKLVHTNGFKLTRGKGLYAVLALAIAGLVLLPFLLGGCGSSAGGADNQPQETAAARSVPKKWPDVQVTPQAVKTATAQTLGYTVAGGTIPLVRTAAVEEPTPGHYNLTVKYNQPGACHSTASNWKLTDFEQGAYQMLGVLFKHPGVDRVEIETYATELSDLSDQNQFEKVFRVVVSRDAARGVAWDAIKGHTVLPKIASEFWVTPKARDDTLVQGSS
ncbi:MAG: hypothetical protein ACYCW5_04130 [Thermoleophilia bacterium]